MSEKHNKKCTYINDIHYVEHFLILATAITGFD